MSEAIDQILSAADGFRALIGNTPVAPVVAFDNRPTWDNTGSAFDNRPTWDNTGSAFDNRPTWDNWNNK